MEGHRYESGVTVKSYRKERVDALPSSNRYDLLQRVPPGSEADMQILESWIDYLVRLKVPFVIKLHESRLQSGKTRKCLTLWKELRSEAER